MKLHGLMFLAFIALINVACTGGGNDASPDGDVDDPQARPAIDAVRTAYVEAMVAADPARVASLYSEDAIVLYPNQTAIVGRPAILEYFTTSFGELTPERFELISDEIQVAGAWAFDRGTYQLHGVSRADGDPIDDHGKYLVILQRQADGSWKVARDMDNSDRPLVENAGGAG